MQLKRKCILLLFCTVFLMLYFVLYFYYYMMRFWSFINLMEENDIFGLADNWLGCI